MAALGFTVALSTPAQLRAPVIPHTASQRAHHSLRRPAVQFRCHAEPRALVSRRTFHIRNDAEAGNDGEQSEQPTTSVNPIRVPSAAKQPTPGRIFEPSEEGEAGFLDTRTGVVVLSCSILVAGFGLYYILQAAGLDEIQAGIWTQVAVSVFVVFGWTASYLTKWAGGDLIYFRQRREYEEEVIRKRYEQLTDEQWTKLVAEDEERKRKRTEKMRKKGSDSQ
eukprot:tig00000241_g20876.t1